MEDTDKNYFDIDTDEDTLLLQKCINTAHKLFKKQLKKTVEDILMIIQTTLKLK